MNKTQRRLAGTFTVAISTILALAVISMNNRRSIPLSEPSAPDYVNMTQYAKDQKRIIEALEQIQEKMQVLGAAQPTDLHTSDSEVMVQETIDKYWTHAFEVVHPNMENREDPALRKKREEEKTNTIVTRLEEQMVSEPYDDSWSVGTDKILREAIDQEKFANSAFAEIDCRSTLCRMDISHADFNSENLFLQEFFGDTGFTSMDVFYTREEYTDGSVDVTMYMSRDGHRLPSLPTESRPEEG